MKLHLRVLSGLQVGDQGCIDPPGGLIGRADGCAMHLRDESVSRAHMELSYRQDGWWALQRSARSPSLVDGIPVGSQAMALKDCGMLQIGGVSIEYTHDRAATLPDLSDSPPTMINVRRQLPTIQHAVLPQMTPMRAAEPPPVEDAPSTLILRRRPPVIPTDAPPTFIRRPAAVSPSSPLPPPPPLVEERQPPTEPPLAEILARVQKERDQLRLERDQLLADRARLSAENTMLREARPAAPALPATTPSAAAPWAQQAIELLQPFSESLEQASSALQEGNATRARTLLREASFGLADLRDLFESSGS